ncbi:rhodanese-like domain-containing protein [Geomonas sp. Red32]|uniref:rhodanese-like domain-containing protein n=1 Tax=Geomonas sp. Red32 TaxID=2912856 RepID=UPI00202CDB58|nr:rhodanese-like domain-containing protein [Geomonas sp. Red32]MCM0081434.1 rhodanese-like domain-containing protein [Geomonas sp. Red32]
MEAKAVLEKIKSKRQPVILDVRTGFEFKSGHIPGAVHAPSWKLLVKMVNLPNDKNSEIVVTCEHGPRAAMASSILGLHGYRNVSLLSGHMAEWRRSRFPIEK